MSQITCDQDGFVRGFPYHDGFLDGVLASNGGKEVHLALRAASGEQRVLTLRRVTALHVEGFREGNIVLNMRMLPAGRLASEEEVRCLLADRLLVNAANLPEDVMVFVLESSFGAEVVAICYGAEVEEGSLALSRSGA